MSRGIWGFTVGTAALDGRFVPSAPLGLQLEAVLAATRESVPAMPAGGTGDSPVANDAR